MRYEQNLFISYAHIDNEPLTPGQQGWITRFHATLEALLSMRLGRKAEIWRDQKLQGNDVFADEIVTRFSRTAVLVSVVSERYVRSDWCTREARGFCEVAGDGDGLVVDNQSRLFKVIKTPVDAQDALPPAMRDVLGYEFFAVEDGAPLELDPTYGPEFAQRFNQKVAKLAWDVSQLLKTLEAKAGDSGSGAGVGVGAAGAPARPIVYLAECSHDRKAERELVEGELRRLGYPVLPERRLPADEAEYLAAVESQLARCALSVHLVGAYYGAVPDGTTQKSTGVHQNALAAARSRQGALARLIWLPAGTQSAQPQQQAFIEALHQDAQAQFGADLITGDLGELRLAIQATLRRLEQPPPKEAAREAAEPGAGGTKLVYLLCDERDRKATLPLRKWLKQAGLDVALPAFEGDAAQLRQANQQLAAECDAVLLFYGAGDEGWKRSIDSELKRFAGYRGGRPLRARRTYLAAPTSADKDDLLDEGDRGLVDGREGFDPAALADFAASLVDAEGPA